MTMTRERPAVRADGLYTQADAARLLGVDRHTVARYARDGHLRFRVRRCDGRKVFKGAEIIRCWQSMYI